MEVILAHEPSIRLSFFLGVFGLVAVWEALAPRRARAFSRWARWPSNLGIVALNTIVLRLAFPIAAVAMAIIAAKRGWGVLNLVQLPAVAKVALAVVALDFAIYLQHVMVHAVPALWRLHRMHHADLDYDVTTGARFHPLEIILSMGIKLAVVALLGAPAVAVIIFEVLLNATAMFNHGNIRLPEGLDRVLRWVVVTPDMHRVHHSVRPDEANSNFGFNLPWWDRLLGTYRAQPVDGHAGMTIGIDLFRTGRDLRLDRMLVQPFLGSAGGYPINRRTFGTDTGQAIEDGRGEGVAAAKLLMVAAIAVGIVAAFLHRDSIDPARLEQAVGAAGPWGPVVFMLLFAAGTVLFAPGAIFALAGGALFGPVLGTIYNLTGATIGAVAAFLLARSVASGWVRRKTGSRLEQLVAGVEAEGWRFVAFVRLVPLFPFNLVNYAFGLTRIRLFDYALTTFICMIPGGIAFTWLGYAGREAAAGSQGAIQKGLLGLGLLAFVLFLPRIIKRMRAAKPITLTVDNIKRRLDSGQRPALIDLRDAADFTSETGHIPGAVNIPMPELEKRLNELDGLRDRELAVYCRTDRRSKQAVALLRSKGFANVLVMDGGMVEWNKRGLPVDVS